MAFLRSIPVIFLFSSLVRSSPLSSNRNSDQLLDVVNEVDVNVQVDATGGPYCYLPTTHAGIANACLGYATTNNDGKHAVSGGAAYLGAMRGSSCYANNQFSTSTPCQASVVYCYETTTVPGIPNACQGYPTTNNDGQHISGAAAYTGSVERFGPNLKFSRCYANSVYTTSTLCQANHKYCYEPSAAAGIQNACEGFFTVNEDGKTSTGTGAYTGSMQGGNCYANYQFQSAEECVNTPKYCWVESAIEVKGVNKPCFGYTTTNNDGLHSTYLGVADGTDAAFLGDMSQNGETCYANNALQSSTFCEWR